jgi:hypothetical protein
LITDLITDPLSGWVRRLDYSLCKAALAGKGGTMAKFTIEYFSNEKEDEEVEASHYDDIGEWIDFKAFDQETGRDVTVLRIKAQGITRISRQS